MKNLQGFRDTRVSLGQTLNFHRLFHEDRPVKMRLMLRQLATLSDKLSPDNALALYFIGYLQWKRDGAVDPRIVSRLRGQLDASTYWRTRFAARCPPL